MAARRGILDVRGQGLDDHVALVQQAVDGAGAEAQAERVAGDAVPGGVRILEHDVDLAVLVGIPAQDRKDGNEFRHIAL